MQEYVNTYYSPINEKTSQEKNSKVEGICDSFCGSVYAGWSCGNSLSIE